MEQITGKGAEKKPTIKLLVWKALFPSHAAKGKMSSCWLRGKVRYLVLLPQKTVQIPFPISLQLTL